MVRLFVIALVCAVSLSGSEGIAERTPHAFWLVEFDGSSTRLLGASLMDDFTIHHVPVSGIYRDTAGKSPGSPRARANFGVALMEQGDLDGALREFQSVLQFSFRGDLSEPQKNNARLNAQTNIAQILLTAGRNEDAERFLRNAWLETPGFPAFGVGLSMFSIQAGRLNEAKAILDDAISSMPLYRSSESFFAGKLYFNRSVVKQLLGDCVGADEDYRFARQYPDVQWIEICKASNDAEGKS